jgi:hypothetical protein
MSQGEATVFGSCAAYVTALGSCFGNNTASPYIFTQPPFTTGDYLPNYALAAPFESADGTSDTFWQLAQDEAIVTIITLPPQAAYFGYQTYLLERNPVNYGGTDPGVTCTTTAGTKSDGHLETADCYDEEFGYFTSAINNANFSATAGFKPPWNSYGNSGTPTSTNTIAIITTANSAMATNMIGYFGPTTTSIFTEEMPQEIAGQPTTPPGLYIGKGGAYDTFATVIRLSLPQSKTNETAWLTGSNVLVYRVANSSYVTSNLGVLYTPSQASGAINPQSQNNVETTSAASHTCGNSVTTNLDGILQYIGCQLQTWAGNNTPVAAGHAYAVYQAKVGTTIVAGPHCIAAGTNCAGGTQDNNYYRSYVTGKLQNQYPIFVVGVLHSASSGDPNPNSTPINNADYTGISAADNTNNTGVSDSADPNATAEYAASSPVLTGSAKSVLMAFTNPDGSTLYSSEPAAVHSELNNLYIHIFYRQDNSSPDCTEEVVCAANLSYTTLIQTGASPAPGSPPVIPDSDPVLLTERGYLLPPPESGTNPTPKSLLTGAAAASLESPYIVCDTAESECCDPTNMHCVNYPLTPN